MDVHPWRRWFGVLALLTASVGVAAPAAAQQGYTITGRVVEASSQRPLDRVSVFVGGTQFGTLTDEQGRFTLRAQLQTGTIALTFSHIGHGRMSRPVQLGGNRAVDLGTIEMQPTAVQLTEVVVTGTGSPTERQQLGNTITSVRGEEVNEAPAAQSVDKALQGKVLGAVISQNNGQPGGGVSIRLRGTGSILGGAEPLIVIDGVIAENNSEALVSLGANASRGGAALSNSLADIAPGDIERVEVVKGAAAAALYGSRANNGVIQIFTKRGTQGKPQVTYRVEATTGKVPKYFEMNESPTAGRGDVLFGGAKAIGAPITRYLYQDQIFQRSRGATNQLSVTGGNTGTSYYLSGLWQNESGIVRSTGLNNVNARASLTQQLSDKLSLTVKGNYIQRRTDFVPEGEQTQGVITTLIFTPTSFNPAYNPNLGRYPYSPIIGTNPLDVIANWKAQDNINRFIGSFNARWTPLSSVTVNYLFGLDRGDEAFTYYIPPQATGASFTGSVQNPTRAIQRYNNDLTATHKGHLLPAIEATSTLGFRQTADRYDEVRAAALGLSPGQTTVGSGGATPSSSQGITEIRTLGGFVEERLGFGKRLYLTGAANYEANSAFGPDQRWQLYPRLGASWNVNEEPFWNGTFLDAALTRFRLRAAWGQTGGQPPSAYSIFNNYAVGSRAGKPALTPGSIAGNTNLKPERQTEIEAGFDLSFLNDRASLEFTGYQKRSKDLVLYANLPLSSGFSSQLQNVGELTNKGVELGLNALVADTRWMQWNTRIGYSANQSRVEKLVTASDTLIYGYLNAVVVGQPVGEFYGAYFPRDAQGNRVTAGWLGSNCQPIAGTEGIIVSRARSNDGKCTILKKFLGSPEPKFTLNWGNDLTIGPRTTVSFLLDGRFGNKVVNFTRRISEYFGAGARNANEQCLLVAGATRCQYTLNFERHLLYEEFVEDGSFVKLRELSVRHTMDYPWVRALGPQSVTVSLAGRNLQTWTKYTGIDPEVNLFSANTVARGVEFGTSPIPRTVALGVTVNF
ncbi:MAG: SusC/RagA family TonB-linked outer membrane protein [Gemmatimonadaceae bacterium]